jgi:uncharacterized protein YndB with AHSA1/START domain
MSVDFTVQRTIAAPPYEVWRAWSEPAYVRRWWGPLGFTAPVARMDFREGGTSLVAMRGPEGPDIYTTWHYRLIVPVERIEFDQYFADERGARIDPSAAGIPPGVPQPVPHVVTLAAVDGATTVAVTEYGYQEGPMAQLSQTGQEQCLQKMAELLESGGP